MHVSSEFRQRDTSDVATNPGTYAWAGSTSNFIAVLQELNTPRRDEPTTSTRPPEGDHAASTGETSSEAEHEPETAPVTDAEQAPSETSDSTNNVDDNATTESADTPEMVDSEATVPPGGAPDGEDGASSVATLPDADADPVAPLITTSRGVSQKPTPLTAEPDADAATSRAAASPPAAFSEPPHGTLPIDVDGAVDIDSADPAPEAAVSTRPNAFPKSLNAMLAESAVRGVSNSEETPEFSRFQMVPDKNVTALLEGTEADGIPEQRVPLPQAPALEAAGVRVEAPAGPRIPLANLPGELSQQIHLMQQEGTKTMRIRLVPENLGEIRIEIRGHGDTMRVHMTSANPAVRDALDSQMNELRQALQKQGLDLANVTVDAGPDQRHRPHDREDSSSPAAQRPVNRLVTDSHNTTNARVPTETTPGSLNVLA